ncbi:MAG: GNAT family N-acetyltransferase [Planctomycetota bacterium]
MGATGDIRIRVGEVSDARGLAELSVATWRAAYTGLMPEELLSMHSVEQREALFAKSPDPKSGRRLWVAEDAERIVAYASAGRARGPSNEDGLTGELYAIYVAAELWSAGLGQRLLAEVVAYHRSLGLRRCLVWVLTANERARRFYERAGFELDVEREEKEFLGFRLWHTRYALGL